MKPFAFFPIFTKVNETILNVALHKVDVPIQLSIKYFSRDRNVPLNSLLKY